MALSETVLNPVAVSLHTRDREEDYHWYPGTGSPKLWDRLRELHLALIADLDAKPASPATFLMLDQGDRIGFLIATLKTNRRDHMNTRFDDTLLLEFDRNQRGTSYRLAAALLGPHSFEIQQQFLDYAEDYFQRRATVVSPPAIPISISPKQQPLSDSPRHPHSALRANPANCQRLAGLLECAAEDPAFWGTDVLIVSTGFAGKDKFQPFTAPCQRLIALSRSSSIPDDGEVALSSASEKKKTSSLLVLGSVALVLACGLLLAFWGNFFAIPSSTGYDNKSNNLNGESNGLKRITTDSGDESMASKEKSGHKSDSERSAIIPRIVGIVGPGTAPHGQGGLLVMINFANSDLKPRE